MRMRFFPVLLLAFFLTAVWALPAAAAEFQVTKTADTADGVCDDDCSLREAVVAAWSTNNPGPDTIIIPAGTYPLNRVYTGPEGNTGVNVSFEDLDIDEDLVLEGTGPGQTMIRVEGRFFRVIEVLAGIVEIRNLTIQNGHQSTPGAYGGCIVNRRGAHLILDNVVVEGCQAIEPAEGGGGIGNYGELTIRNGSVVHNNTTMLWGGGIYNHNDAVLNISDSVVNGNRVIGRVSDRNGRGGGIENRGRLESQNNRFAENRTRYVGGGIFNLGGTLVSVGDLFEGNQITETTNVSPEGDGGGLYSAPRAGGPATEVELRRAIFRLNTATGSGGAIFNYIGSELTVIESILERNTAGFEGGPEGNGGAIVNYATMRLERSTVSSNTAYGRGAAVYLDTNTNRSEVSSATIANNFSFQNGGGVYIGGGNMTVESSTLAYNHADTDNSGNGFGGGIFRRQGAVALRNTILAVNALGSGENQTGANCSGTIGSLGHNLFGHVEGCNVSPLESASGDVQEASAADALNPFANLDGSRRVLDFNGGPTPTIPLAAGSAAIDAGDPAAPETDQRGITRQGLPDIGAYEVSCGDNNVAGNETCDAGEANNDSEADACRTTCLLAACGDGILDSGEACDNGADNDDVAPSACRTTCRLPSCGDAIWDFGEECDMGMANNDEDPNSCRTNCLNPSCGDGAQDRGEACDDGNASNEDACLNTCESAACGDGFVQSGVEGCDDGNTVTETCNYGEENCTVCDDSCREVAGETAFCGDGEIDAADGEICDDGNRVTETCLYGQRSCEVCDTSCQEVAGETAFCGDGVRNGREACDDANAVDDDDCRNNCVAATCGDGIVNGTDECDDGNPRMVSGPLGPMPFYEVGRRYNRDGVPDACRTTCLNPSCGDGVVDTGEVCDGNADADGNPCRADCQAFAFCGNTLIDGDEACDDGDANSNDPNVQCRADCRSQSCGDGIVDNRLGETCDGNPDAEGNACRDDCRGRVVVERPFTREELLVQGVDESGGGGPAPTGPTTAQPSGQQKGGLCMLLPGASLTPDPLFGILIFLLLSILFRIRFHLASLCVIFTDRRGSSRSRTLAGQSILVENPERRTIKYRDHG